MDPNITNIEATREQQRKDKLMVSVFESQQQRGKTDSFIYDMVAQRASELHNKLQAMAIETINQPELIISELDNIEVEPGNNICDRFPAEVFNYTDRLTLLNEGYAIYAEPDDKRKVEDQLEIIIHQEFRKLTSLEQDILFCSTDLYDNPASMPWYEWDIFSTLRTGVDYDATMRKVEAYKEQCLTSDRDYHRGILDCHQLFDELYAHDSQHDPNLTEIFGRLVQNDIEHLENPAPYYAQEQKSKSYRQAVEDCQHKIYSAYHKLQDIDKIGHLGYITYCYMEKTCRMLACYLYNLAPDEKEELTPDDVLQMKLPLSDFDYLRIRDAKEHSHLWDNLPFSYLDAYVDKEELWDTCKYNLPPLNDFD